MMKNKKNITEEVEKTISLMDSQENLNVSPFLYTRINSRIAELKKSGEAGIVFSGVQILKVSLFVLLFSLNLFSIIVHIKDDDSTTKLRQEYLDSIRTEYTSNPGYYSGSTGGGN